MPRVCKEKGSGAGMYASRCHCATLGCFHDLPPRPHARQDPFTFKPFFTATASTLTLCRRPSPARSPFNP